METKTEGFKTKDGQVVEVGTEIYYTGDAANQSGVFAVDLIYSSDFYPIMVDLVELNCTAGGDGPRDIKGLMPSSFEPGPGCRFITMKLYEEQKAEKIKIFKDRYAALNLEPRPPENVPPLDQIKKFEPGQYTIVRYGDFGFLQQVKLNLVRVVVEPWAQYRSTVMLVGRPFGKRRDIGIRFLEVDRFAIWKGFVDVRTSMWVERERKNYGGQTVSISKSLLSCDGEYLRMALDSVKEAPLVVKMEYGY